MNYTTFNELVNRGAEDTRGSNFQVTGFYQASNDKEGLGKFFGMNHHDEMLLGHLAGEVSDTGHYTTLPGADLDFSYMFNLFFRTRADMREITVTLAPKSESYGAVINYHHNLEKVAKGLYFSFNMPIVNIKNDMHMTTVSDHPALKFGMENYFKGNFIAFLNDYMGNYYDYTNYEELTRAKISGAHSKTGVADIELKLGYNFLEKENYHLGLNIGATFPTGNKHKSYYVFDPIVGNGQHWALGAGLEGAYRVWENDEQNIKIGMAVDYRYLFENTQWRTPGLKTNAGVLRQWGQYHLLGQNRYYWASPAANIITQKCDVTPGSQIEGLANFAYNDGGFTFDLGYNIFWRGREEVRSKETLATETYGVVVPTYDPEDYAFSDDYIDEQDGAYLTQANLDFHHAETPAILTHKVYTGLGYSFKEWKTPLMMGLGGSYEFAGENSAPDMWSVYGKLGVAF